MSRVMKYPLRSLTDIKRQVLEQLVHARSERADVMKWTRELLAVADGKTYVESAKLEHFRVELHQ